MTRRKVNLAYIESDSDRKACYRKRKRSLINKAREIETLCGVQVCAIVYSMYDQEPEVYPSRDEARAVLARFYGLPEVERKRKMVNQEMFIRQQIIKAQTQLIRCHREKKRLQLEKHMYRCVAGLASLDDVNPADVAEMNSVMDQVMRDISSRMARMKRKGVEKSHGSGPGSGSGSGMAAIAEVPPAFGEIHLPLGEMLPPPPLGVVMQPPMGEVMPQLLADMPPVWGEMPAFGEVPMPLGEMFPPLGEMAPPFEVMLPLLGEMPPPMGEVAPAFGEIFPPLLGDMSPPPIGELPPLLAEMPNPLGEMLPAVMEAEMVPPPPPAVPTAQEEEENLEMFFLSIGDSLFEEIGGGSRTRLDWDLSALPFSSEFNEDGANDLGGDGYGL